MNLLTLSFILISVLLSVVAQILLKQGMSSASVQGAIHSGGITAVMVVLTNFFVLGGLAAYVSSAGIWLVVLSKVDVSKAYPFVGLGFIGTMLFAYWFLNEPISAGKIIGTVLIVAGIWFISNN